jgi:putative transposase
MDDAIEKITDWKEEYNTFRPHSSLQDLTPDELIEEQKKSPNFLL